MNKKKPRVYIFGYMFGENWFIKIGVSSDVQKRARQLQTPTKPKFAWIKNCDSINQARSIEKFIHKIMDDKRTEGEWFRLASEEEVKWFEDTITIMESFVDDIAGNGIFESINIKR